VRALTPLVLAALLATAACESESDPTGTDNPGSLDLNEIATSAPLNATSIDTLVYFSFETGTLVQKSADWDIALRRYEVRLNSGVTGNKGVLGFSLGNNENATDAEVLAFTPQNTLAAFDAIRAADIPAEPLFQSDRLVEDKFGFVNIAGAPVANAAAYWKVRTASGGFALMRVTAITYNQQGSLTSISIETRVQNGTSLGTAQAATIPVGSSAVNIDLATNAAVTANGCNWDIQVHPQTFEMTTNAACNAGTYPGPASPTFAAATSASDAPEYGLFLSELVGPIPNSIAGGDDAPFRYNLENTNRLHPTFNTYLIMTGENVYKLQVINYYNESGASGYPTLRYARIR
jgi:hypothetical protein